MAGSAKRVVGSILFVIALVAVMAFYFILFADAEQVNDVPGTNAVPEVALGVAIALGVIVLLLILLMVIRSYDRREEEAEEAEAFFVPEQEEAEFEEVFEEEPTPGPRPLELKVYDIWKVPQETHAWGPSEKGMFSFFFPRSVEAGVYVNDYIPIDDDGTRLKLRTLLAGPVDFAGDYVVPEPAPPRLDRSEAEASRRPPRPQRTDVPGDEFMRELEARYEGRPTTHSTVTVPPAEEVYYDYKGDIHHVIDVEGIGDEYTKRLGDLGITTTARLCYEDAAKLARRLGVPQRTVESWQAMAELMKVSGIGKQYAEALVRAGIEGIDELKRRRPGRIADQVNRYLEGLDSSVLGSSISERRVEGWQEAARSMRRVRLKVPEA